ncbi:hypothetical protein ADU37_CDS07210 [Thermococcus sp. 2319x1]|nr:hypothetical protein ADU37_CDS07210 [Thermococcus sp. 2319x1]
MELRRYFLFLSFFVGIVFLAMLFSYALSFAGKAFPLRLSQLFSIP